MNASYKIVLLGAFALFVAVVGYYVLSGPGDDPPADDATDRPLAQNPIDDDPQPPATDDPATPPVPPVRPGLDTPTEETPPTEVTIGPTETEDVDVRVGPTSPTETGEGDRPGPLDPTGETPTRPGPDTPAIETTDPDRGDIPRPGPGIDVATPEETTETVTPDPGNERTTPTTPGRTPRTYTVQPGDTFASIAVQIYDDQSAWFEIAQANPSVDPKRLQVDQVIVLPKRDATPREREEVTPPAPGQDQTYTVRPGDNLSRIAKRFYDDSEAWDLIYNRNRDKIGPSPDNLKAGMELIIPQAYSGAE